MERGEAGQFANELRALLIAYVQARIGPQLRRRRDAEDIVQSAFKSFFKLETMPGSQEDLRTLLFRFTEWKLGKVCRRELAEKRDFRREATPSDLPADGSEAHPFEAKQWGPEEEAVWDELERLRDGWWEALSETQRQILRLKEQGYSQPQIGGLVGLSDRTVRRYLEEAETRLRGLLGMDKQTDDAGGSRG
jgi:RNA polymerase sigma-70 factor (ECF subfamily)